MTGLADPGPVVQALWPDDALEPGAVLDSVVTVVDASHFQQQLRDPSTGELAQLQVAHADVILLNKTDLVGDTETEAVERCIRDVNATAEVIRTQRSVVDLARILNLGAIAAGGSGRRGAPALTEELRVSVSAENSTSLAGARTFARGAQMLAAASAVHDDSIGTVYMEVPGVLSELRFREWLVRYARQTANGLETHPRSYDGMVCCTLNRRDCCGSRQTMRLAAQALLHQMSFERKACSAAQPDSRIASCRLSARRTRSQMGASGTSVLRMKAGWCLSADTWTLGG